ncbi:ParB/RepB/Spo0J family partition protein [Leptolyngbya sp. FACHB-8]|nr:ParB/RepB/Spo0J family partition protein [Leptolyngbya sp. FACHB-8]MBD1913179.1 ParB/RepB/Spo0J family partition protein [Leptolyngbya sp. FACHB-8]
MKQLFGEAGQSHQVHQLKNRVEELEAELTQLRSGTLSSQEKVALEQQIEELTSQLAATGGTHEISLSLIEPDPNQPRATFPKILIQERAESLTRHGQKTPIIVVPQANGRYVLFEGELRWRAASLLGWKTLKAVFLLEEAVDEGDIFEGQLVTSIHSQKLHDLDLAAALVRLITHRYPYFEDQEKTIPKTLKSVIRRLERGGQLSKLSEIRIANHEEQELWLESVGFKQVEERDIFAVLLGLQLHPVSISNNIFPLLDLPEDLKQVIKSEGLESSKARELNKLTAELLEVSESKARSIRLEVSEKVVQEKLPLSQTKALVKDTLKQYQTTNSKVKQPKVAEKAIKTIQSIELQEIEQDQLEELRQALKNKLQEIERMIGAV